MQKKIAIASAALGLWLAPVGLGLAAAHAADCLVEAEDVYDMTDDEVNALYSCMQAAMLEGYTKGDNVIAADYRNWTISGTRPGPDASHGNRFLLTFANDIAAETYLAFATEGVDVPVGGILAKESIAVKKGKGKVGPLFIMEKVGEDAAPDAAGWLYSAVQPNGKNMKIKQSFCHDCHLGFEDQDMLAYPAEEFRVSN